MSNITMEPKLPGQKTHLVTLVEGEYYGHGLTAFHRGKPVAVPEDVATTLAQKVTAYPILKGNGRSETHTVAKFKIERLPQGQPGGQIAPVARTRTRTAPAGSLPPLEGESATDYLARLAKLNDAPAETQEERVQREADEQETNEE